MMRLSAVLCAVVLLAAQGVATFAESHMGKTGFYGVLGGGGVFVHDSKKVGGEIQFGDDNPLKIEGNERRDAYLDIGFGLAAAFGYDFGAFRVDGEASYLSARGDIALTGTPAKKAEKEDNLVFTSIGATANVWYDVNTRSAWTPYVGAGVGGANISARQIYKGIGLELSVTYSGWAFAYQAGAGVRYDLTDTIAVDLGYRLFAAISPKLTNTGTFDEVFDIVTGESLGTYTETWEPNVMTHRVTLGVRYAF